MDSFALRRAFHGMHFLARTCTLVAISNCKHAVGYADLEYSSLENTRGTPFMRHAFYGVMTKTQNTFLLSHRQPAP